MRRFFVVIYPFANKKVRQSITAATKAIALAPENEKEKVADELITDLTKQIYSLINLAEKLAKVSPVEAAKHIHTIMTIVLM